MRHYRNGLTFARIWSRLARCAVVLFIATVVVCGAVVTTLWYRSQHRTELFAARMDQKVLVIECYTNAIGLFILPAAQADRKGRFAHSTYPPAAFDYSVFGNLAKSYSGSFGIIQGGGIWGIVLPPWPAPALGAALAAAWIFRALRRRARQSKGRCLVCAYNLTGNISGVCPECGTAFQNAPAQSAAGTLTGGVGAP